jgi:RNA polymerase sigma-70 factor, ECF subfamily
LSRVQAESNRQEHEAQRKARAPVIHSGPMSAARKLPAPSKADVALQASPAALYETHLQLVWRSLRRLGVADELLEDATQDVFVTVHRRWESYQPGASSIETWLLGIVIRVAHYHRRTLRRRLARIVPWLLGNALHEISSDLDGPAEIVAKRQAALLLDRILHELADHQREILVLVDVEQVTVPEASAILGINLNTAYTRLRAARRCFQNAVNRLHESERQRGGGHHE